MKQGGDFKKVKTVNILVFGLSPDEGSFCSSENKPIALT
jgi:hypothetical protein